MTDVQELKAFPDLILFKSIQLPCCSLQSRLQHTIFRIHRPSVYFGTIVSREQVLESILLDTNLPYSAQSERAHKTNYNHPRKQGPEDCAISGHEGTGGRLVDLTRGGRPRVTNDRCYRQSNRRAELRAGVEHCAAQRLRAYGKDGGNDK